MARVWRVCGARRRRWARRWRYGYGYGAIKFRHCRSKSVSTVGSATTESDERRCYKRESCAAPFANSLSASHRHHLHRTSARYDGGGQRARRGRGAGVCVCETGLSPPRVRTRVRGWWVEAERASYSTTREPRTQETFHVSAAMGLRDRRKSVRIIERGAKKKEMFGVH